MKLVAMSVVSVEILLFGFVSGSVCAMKLAKHHARFRPRVGTCSPRCRFAAQNSMTLTRALGSDTYGVQLPTASSGTFEIGARKVDFYCNHFTLVT